MITQWFHVLLGAALGTVVGAIVAVGLWAALAAANSADAVTIALLGGLFIGVVAGGYGAGRLVLRSVFHGALTGVLMTGGVALVSIGAGGTAPLGSLVGLLAAGLVLGSFGGWLGHRQTTPPQAG